MTGNNYRIGFENVFIHRIHDTCAHHRHTPAAHFSFVRRDCLYFLFLFFGSHVRRIVPFRVDDSLSHFQIVYELMHYVRKSFFRGEGQEQDTIGGESPSKHLRPYIRRRFFVTPTTVDTVSHEFLRALLVGAKINFRPPAGNVFHQNGIVSVWDSGLSRRLPDEPLRNRSGPERPIIRGLTEDFTLASVTSRFVRGTGNHPFDRLIESIPFPPRRIQTG